MEIDLGIKTRKDQPASYRASQTDSHCRDRNEALERAQNLIVSSVVRNLIGLWIMVV